jgi:membrane protease YdiL (CAAX protease family)
MSPVVRQILTFILLNFLFSLLPYAVAIHTYHAGVAEHGSFALMWCPACAAFATCALFRIDLASLGWNWRPAKYETLGYCLPLLYAIPVYACCWIFVKGSFALDAFEANSAGALGIAPWRHLATFGLEIPQLATIGVISSTASALGEEIGWRGFLLSRLAGRFGFTIGCLMSGGIWALWHYPLILGAGYSVGTNPAFAIPCFSLMIVSLAFVMGWLRLKSGSLWPCALLHASHNLFLSSVFDRMTAPVGPALYITTEFGAGTALAAGAVALYFWLHRKELLYPALAS